MYPIFRIAYLNYKVERGYCDKKRQWSGDKDFYNQKNRSQYNVTREVVAEDAVVQVIPGTLLN